MKTVWPEDLRQRRLALADRVAALVERHVSAMERQLGEPPTSMFVGLELSARALRSLLAEDGE